MKIEGEHTVPAARAVVWRALMDPAILQRVIPGCEKLEPAGEGAYRAVLRAGVGNIRGNFTGEVKVSDVQAERAYTLTCRAKAGVGFAEGSGRVELEEEAPASTRVRFSGELKTGGMLAAVAGRLMQAAARKNLDELFANLTRECARLS